MKNKEEFLAKIKNKSNQKLEVLRRIKDSRLPLIIYGTGEYAKILIDYLKEHNITVKAACIDNVSFDKQNPSLMGINVYPLEKISLMYDSFNVLIGFADFKLAEKKLNIFLGCQNVFFLDSPLNFDSFDYNFIKNNLDAFSGTYNLLEDALSRNTMTAFINAKISGRPDDLYNLVQSDKYFPSDIIELSSEEVFVDAGAFDGDTILKFLKNTNGCYKKIYAFEPDKNSFGKLEEMTKNRSLNNIRLYNKGVWKEKDTIRFNVNSDVSTMSSITSNGNYSIEVDSIDNLVDPTEPTYIKMEVQGAALEALKGASNVIRTSKPKLAIAIDYNPSDLITIPTFIFNTAPGYKFYLRHYLYITHMLILYAIYD